MANLIWARCAAVVGVVVAALAAVAVVVAALKRSTSSRNDAGAPLGSVFARRRHAVASEALARGLAAAKPFQTRSGVASC